MMNWADLSKIKTGDILWCPGWMHSFTVVLFCGDDHAYLETFSYNLDLAGNPVYGFQNYFTRDGWHKSVEIVGNVKDMYPWHGDYEGEVEWQKMYEVFRGLADR